MNTPDSAPAAPLSSARLHDGLRRFERQWKTLQRRLGAGRFLVAAVVLLLTAAMLDGALGLEGSDRSGLTLLFYLSLAVAGWLLWARPLLRPLSLKKIAWMIEDSHPELNEKLISAVELEQERGGSVSRDMILRTIEDTELDLGRVDPARDLAPPRWLKILPAAVAAIMLFLMVIPGLYLPLRIKRIILPATADAAVSTFALRWTEAPPSRAVEDSVVPVAVHRTRDTGAEVVLEVHGEQNQRQALRWNAERGVFEGSFTVPNHPVWVFARSGRAATHRVRIDPLLRPWIEGLTVEIHPPAYTGARVRTLGTWPRELDLVAGSRIHLQVTGSAPLSQVDVVSEQATIAIPLNGDRGAAGDWTPDHSGELRLRIIDREGLEPVDTPRMSLRVLPDQPPTVTWLAPESDVLLREGDSLPLAWTVADDFGVVESRIEIRKNQDKPVLATVPVADGRYTYDFSDWHLGGGDQLQVRALASDGLGQRGESTVRTLSVAGGLDHPEAQAYLRDLTALREHLAGVGPDLVSLQETRAGIFEALTYATPSAMENLEYHRVRWQVLTGQFDQHLHHARTGTDALRRQTFFRQGAPALELLSRYSEQERLRMHLADPAVLPQSPGLAGFYELANPTLAELAKRAEFALPALQAEKLHAMVSLVAPRTDPASRRLLGDLRHRAVLFAARHAPEAVELLESLDLDPGSTEPAQGLSRWIWRDQTSYIDDPGRAGSLAANDPRIQHPSLTSLGQPAEQRVSVLWLGRLRVEKEGTYRFQLESDDGSRLYLNGNLVVQNDGNHAMETRSGEIALSPGLHNLRVVYFNSGGPGGVVLRWQPPGAGSFEGVPPQVLVEPGDIGATQFVAKVGELAGNLKRQASDLRELERWMARIRERLDEAPRALSDLLAQVEDETLPPELADRLALETAALRQRAETEGEPVYARLAEELERASEREDTQAAQQILEAADAVARDRAQEDWTEQLRRQTERALALLEERAQADSIEQEVELQARQQEEADRLRALAELRPGPVADSQLEREVREAARELDRMADVLEKSPGDPTASLAAMENLQEALDAHLDRAEEASDQALQQAELDLRTALPTLSENLASHAQQLEEADQALAALETERQALEAVLQELREPLELRREEHQRISPEDVRDQRLAQALERQMDQAVENRDSAAAAGLLREMQVLATAQEQARREALTQAEQRDLAEQVRQATNPALSPAEQEAFDRMERLAEAREQVEQLARAVDSLGNRPLPERLADELARAQAAVNDPSVSPPPTQPLDRNDLAQLEAGLERTRPVENPLTRALAQQEAGAADSEQQKSQERALREASKARGELERLSTPEGARMREMAESVERQIRAEDLRGAEQTLAAMERQMEEWAEADPVVERLAEEASVPPTGEGSVAEQLAQAAEALARAAEFQEEVPSALAGAQKRASEGELGQAARELAAAGVEPDLAESARRLDEKIQALQEEAARASAQESLGKREREAMERLADALAARDLRKAAQQAGQTGKAAKGLQAQLAEVQEESRDIAQALEQARKEVANPYGEPAKDQLASAAEALAGLPGNEEALPLAQAAQSQAEKGQWESAAEKAQQAAEAAPSPGQPGEASPSSPAAPSPGQPGEASPSSPSAPSPGQPGEASPSSPSAPSPGQPGEASPSSPSAPSPGQPGEASPSSPSAPSPEQPGEASPSSPSAPSPGQPGDAGNPLASAMQAASGQLAEAETALRQGNLPTGLESLRAASESLAQAQAATAAAAASPASAASSPASAASQPGQAAGSAVSTTQGGGGGEGGSEAESQGGAEEGLWKGPEGGEWDGARSDMETGDPRRAGQHYSPYYRRAMQQYMRDLQKEQQP